ncbi:MAG: hypothetical protein HY812_12155 [Planctomycetes bacterium]|nr:hypothetical protein [Planctomycetota bacterium]
MSMRPLLILLAVTGCATTARQEASEAPPAAHDPFSVDLGYNECGLSFGNSPEWTGLRFNLQDDHIQRINGLNLTFWTPREIGGSSVNGLAFGLIWPSAGDLTGISLGGLATWAAHDLTGLGGSLGLAFSGRNMIGLHFGGLGTAAGGDVWGARVGGLLNLAEGDVRGLSFALLFNSAIGNATGFNLGGLVNLARRDMTGLNFGLGNVVAGGDLLGFNFAGFRVVAGEPEAAEVHWFSRIPADVGYDVEQHQDNAPAQAPPEPSRGALNGMSAAFFTAKGDEVNGVALAGIRTQSDRLKGVQIAGYNLVRESQRGVTIGVYNQSQQLEGFSFQLGLLNHIPTNPAWARWLPLFNAGF